MPAKDLTRAQRAGHVGIEDVVPLFVSHIEGGRALRLPRAVDEDVHFAKCLDAFVQRLLQRFSVADVGNYFQGATAKRSDLARSFRDLLFPSGSRDDISARF